MVVRAFTLAAALAVTIYVHKPFKNSLDTFGLAFGAQFNVEVVNNMCDLRRRSKH